MPGMLCPLLEQENLAIPCACFLSIAKNYRARRLGRPDCLSVQHDRINGAVNRHVVRRDPESGNGRVVTDERLDTRVAAWFEQKRVADGIKLAGSRSIRLAGYRRRLGRLHGVKCTLDRRARQY